VRCVVSFQFRYNKSSVGPKAENVKAIVDGIAFGRLPLVEFACHDLYARSEQIRIGQDPLLEMLDLLKAQFRESDSRNDLGLSLVDG
jgi:hypothetical protein